MQPSSTRSRHSRRGSIGGRGGWVELGVRAPLASRREFASSTGIATDVERWEAFVPRIGVARTAFHWSSDTIDRAGVDLRIAPTLWYSHGFTDQVELYFGYGGRVLYRGKNARAGAGWGGRWRMSIDEGNYGRNSTHHVEAGGDFLAGRLRPGATVRIPLDDDTGADLAIGLSLGIVLD